MPNHCAKYDISVKTIAIDLYRASDQQSGFNHRQQNYCFAHPKTMVIQIEYVDL